MVAIDSRYESMNNLVSVECNGAIATITLAREERHNSLVPDLLAGLLAALGDIAADASSRVIILRAAGRSFSTGGDVGAFYDHRDDIEAYAHELVGLLNEAILALFDAKQPVVAAVDGAVTGGSLGLVLASDIVVTTPRASFQPWYVDVGFSPDGGWTAILPDLIGRSRAACVQLLNRRIDAAEAVAWGIATELVETDALDARIVELSEQLAAKRTGSVQCTRRLLRPANLVARLEQERQHFVAQIGTDEALAGMREYLFSEDRRREG